MNILIVSQHAGMAGSTYSITYLAKGLSERGHKVYVACPANTLMQQLLISSKVQHIPMQIRNKLDRQNIRHIAQMVKEHQIDIIDAQSSKDRYTTILARWYYKLPVKLVHTRRQLALSVGILGQSWFYEKGTDKIIAVSRGVKQSLVNIGISAEHIKVIYNGTPREKYDKLDLQKVKDLKEKYAITAGDFVIGCVARRKEQDQLLNAIALLDQPVKVIFVGIESEKNFQEIISGYGLPHKVHFTGAVPNTEVLNYYPLFDIKILPSKIEGLSQSLLEAMALKIPVIATDLGGNGELIEEGKNGYLFENENIQQLASLIDQLRQSENLRRQLGEYGQHTALDTFSIDRTIQRHELLFQQLCQDIPY
ncbi:glycosyltransferase family 4 protein [Catalinimonas niigatensis]|uniref:glycosyltransferase family 4 protein n=1 Tax=Catalinimonas niigatensis TaxID=1397264 RepID=UPI002667034E|nr:glycosyltransferase family 4 protein [Catalinimonas niigatensis]WPP52542.1 glycosyltransferase family 4 protein [Catalinimonas niigatensis]